MQSEASNRASGIADASQRVPHTTTFREKYKLLKWFEDWPHSFLDCVLEACREKKARKEVASTDLYKLTDEMKHNSILERADKLHREDWGGSDMEGINQYLLYWTVYYFNQGYLNEAAFMLGELLYTMGGIIGL